MSDKKYDEPRRIHLVVKGPIIRRHFDRIICKKWQGLQSLMTLDETKVTCKNCLKAMKKLKGKSND